MAKPKTTDELAAAAAEYQSTLRALGEERDDLVQMLATERLRHVDDVAATARLHADELNRERVNCRVAQAENETLRALLRHEQLQSRTYAQFAAEISQSLVHVRAAAQHQAQTVDDVIAKANLAAHEVLAETKLAETAEPFGAPGAEIKPDEPAEVPAFITKRNGNHHEEQSDA